MAEEQRSPTIQKMIEAAMCARDQAYCPYSNFRVGAAVLCKDDTIVTGSNVENVSYGLCVCAERNAIMKAVMEGHREFKALSVCCDVLGSFQGSCGACRQVIAEFGTDLDLYLVKPDGTVKMVNFASLFPLAFVPQSLKEDRLQQE